MNTTLGTISQALSKLLLTLFNWILRVRQRDVADVAESLKDLSAHRNPRATFQMFCFKKIIIIMPMHFQLLLIKTDVGGNFCRSEILRLKLRPLLHVMLI